MRASLGLLMTWTAVPLLAVLVFSGAMELLRAALASGLSWRHLSDPRALAFCGGLGFRWLAAKSLGRGRRGDPLDFLDTLEHELTHVLAGYLTFAPPVSLKATLRKGGEVQLKRSNPLAALAPYCVPLWSLLLLLLGAVVDRDLQGIWSLAILFFLGWFAYRLAGEFRFYQTDLQVYGRTFSSLLCAAGLLLSLGVILHARGMLRWDWMAAAPWRGLELLLRGWHHLFA